ncbi:MAG: hypothetical protein LBU60_01770 [Clostridiales bacterium]|jgi:hypothetical protein|nr:hypothetical protein [Clostridiales bacterium]
MNRGSLAFLLIGALIIILGCITTFTLAAVSAVELIDNINLWKSSHNNWDIFILPIGLGTLALFFLIMTIVLGVKFIGYSKLDIKQVSQKIGGMTATAITIAILFFPMGILALIPIALCCTRKFDIVANSQVSIYKKDNEESKDTEQTFDLDAKLVKLNDLKTRGLVDEAEFVKAKRALLASFVQ